MFFSLRFLNGLGPVQIGGIQNMPLEYPTSEYIVYKYFDGCIRKITENLEMYDLAYPLKVVNAPRGCTMGRSTTMAPCPTCFNGGHCVPGVSHSVCTCLSGYAGDDCSERKSSESNKQNALVSVKSLFVVVLLVSYYAIN